LLFQLRNEIKRRTGRTRFVILFAALSCIQCALTLYQRPSTPPPKPADPAKKSRAESYFVKAREYEMLGLGGKALRCYEAAYELDPQSLTIRDLLVEKYLAASQFSRALVLVKGNKTKEQLTDADRRACAGIYLRQGRIGAVTDMLEAIADKRPEEYHTLGLVFESKGNLAKSAQYFRGFLQKNPESPQMWLKTAGLYAAIKRYAAAESVYIEMERRFGQTPEILNGIGLVKLAKGDTALAVNSFKMASLLDSTYEEGNRNLARVYLQQSNWEEAIRCYEKLQTDATHSRTLALLYFYSKKYSQAWAQISRILADSAGDPEMHFYGGLALAALDSTERARGEFQEVLKLHGDSSEAWQQLCFLALREKKFDRALSVAGAFKDAMPRLADAWRMNGYVCNAHKEYALAIGFLQKAIELDSSDALAWFELGTSLERTSAKNEAAAAFKRVLMLRPGYPPAANYLAYMWAEQGIKLDSARALLSMALKKDSLNGAYLDSYAWIFYKMGSLDTAYLYIVKALERINDDPVVYSHYGDILAKKGEFSGALAAYRKGLGLALPDKATAEEISDLKRKINELETTGKNPGSPSPQKKAAP
jgi:tetratricopeptide (TPR) repeat protein